MMAKVDMRTQYEASMLSMTFIMGGIILSIIYLFVYVTLPLWYKIVLIVNLIAAFVFISSFLVTAYQQYKNLMDTLEFQKQMKGGNE